MMALSASLVFGLGFGCGKGEEPVAKDAEQMPKEVTAKVDAAVEAAETLSASAQLRAAIADESRPEAERVRDQWRHPAETLEFFGVKPDSKILELWAGGGWYTQILAPYVGATGQLYVTVYPETIESEYLRKSTQALKQRLSKIPHGDKVKTVEVNTEALDLGLDGEVDVVLTFRNVHNWAKGGYDKAVYAQAFKALKSGGVFGVVEHRAPEGMSLEDSIKTGYMSQAKIIEDAKAAGFELVEISEINANAKDTKDYPEGVWTLPPSLRLKELDQAKYVAIGESDRMTLRFKKP